MFTLFLTTVLSCRDISFITERILNNTFLNPIQKKALMVEFKKLIPTCPLIINPHGKR